MSKVEYNGVTLQYCKTLQFEQEDAYDPSGVDYLYTRFYVVVECTWNANVFPAAAGQIDGVIGLDPGLPPAVSMAGPQYPSVQDGVREVLKRPRGHFKFTDDDDNVLLESPAPAPAVFLAPKDGNAPVGIPGATVPGVSDDKLGPFPRFVNVVKLNGSTTYIVHFGIEFFATECPNRQKNAILSNRWRESMRIDRDQKQVRTHSGRLIMRGTAQDFTDPDNPPSADFFRGVVFPPIPAGFTREFVDVDMTETGLEIAYSCTDRQGWRITDPKGPVTQIRGTYSETTANGATCTRSVRVTVTGGPNTATTQQLLFVAVEIAISKLGVVVDGNGRPDVNGQFITLGALYAGEVSEDIMEPSLTLLVQSLVPVQIVPKPGVPDKVNEAIVGISLGTTNIGTRPAGLGDPFKQAGYSPGPFGEPGNHGIQLLAQILSNPCDGINLTKVVKCQKSSAPLSKACDDQGVNPQGSSSVAAFREGGLSGLSSQQPGAGGFVLTVQPLGNTRAGATLQGALTTVTVNFVNGLSRDVGSFRLDNLSDVYTDYKVDLKYHSEAGVVMLPIADDQPAAPAFISTNAEVATMTAKWTAERFGAEPDLPSSDIGTGYVLLWKDVMPATQEVAPNGQDYVYRRSGVYHYGLTAPPSESEPLAVAALPNLKASYEDNAIPASVWKQGILSPTPLAAKMPGTLRPV